MTPARGERATWRFLGFWENGDLDLAATRANLPADDLHTAELIAGEIWPQMLSYIPGKVGRWHIWNGRCRPADDCGAIDKIIHSYARWAEALCAAVRQRVTAETGTDDKATAAMLKETGWEPVLRYVGGLRRAGGLASLKAVLGQQCSVAEADLDDTLPYRVNTASGLVSLLPVSRREDLEGDAREIIPHAPGQMITYCLGQEWVPGADCPQYRALIWRAAGEDQQVYEYLIRVLGYSLLGHNPRQLVFFLAGPTASGKSKMLEGAARVLAGLAHKAQTALIAHQRYGRNAREENSIRGKRLVTIAETSSRIHIEEAQLKRLTGEDWITVDRHYAAELVPTRVSWLIVIATNQMPTVLAFDTALRRRIVVIPMGPTIPEQLRDDALLERIMETEAAGILNLLVQGCRLAMEDGGLQPPQVVADKTAEYAAEQRSETNWLAERAVYQPVASQNGHPGKVGGVPMSEAWEDYEIWAGRAPHLGRNEFYEALEGAEGVERRGRVFLGFKLKYGG